MTDIVQQIAALEQVLASPDLDLTTRTALETMLHQLHVALPHTDQSGGINLGSAQVGQIDSVVGGDAVAGDKVLGDKIVQQFFGGRPGEDGTTLLRDYLAALLDATDTLRLSRMTEKRQSGSGQDLLPPLRLIDVFTNLTTERWLIATRWHLRRKAQVIRLVDRLGRPDRSFDMTPPEQVRELWIDESDSTHSRTHTIRLPSVATQELFQHYAEDRVLRFGLARPELALEAIAQTPRLMLLGAPGSGKSTALRYLALLLSQHLLDPRNHRLPIGWDAALVPIICPLGLVASALARAQPGQSDGAVLWQVLADLLDGEGHVRQGLGRHLRTALRSGAAVLLFDGLDELPAAPGPDGLSPRTRVSRAVQALARELPHATRIALTCRVLPYEQPPATPRDDWRLPADDGWTVRRIQPFAFGQVRQFVTSWYHSACCTPAAIYAPTEGVARAVALLEQLEQNQRLRVLTASPLLLTMLAILHYNKATGELPRDRAKLYDECVQLLLERWEPVRTPEVRTPGLLERLGIEQLVSGDDLRAVMHAVAFAAHDRLPDPGDGRGVLRGSELEGELSRFLRRLRCDRIDARLREFEQALRDETGLLQEISDDTYMFPHLTFQEYLAACALADSPRLVETAYRVWSSRDGDRWHEVILLLMGRLRQQRKVELQGVQWVQTLCREKTPWGATKDVAQRQRDALLAVDSYQEWEGRVALSSFEREEAEQFERRIAQALVPILAPEPLAPPSDRLRAGRHLAALGDPRPGVCSLEPAWCNVPDGPFLLGSTHQDAEADDDEKPQRTVALPGFHIARYPITNAQWRAFVEAGGYGERRWWSDAGWQAKEQKGWTQPDEWGNPRFNGANQPVVGISWYEATTFCRWLSAELGYDVRLPSEAEWEKAARGTDGRAYPWGDMWDAATANTRESGIGTTTPVGCFPDGASPCGALDMSGNVFEWTATPWTEDYSQSDGTTRETEDGEHLVWRGGAWANDRRNARCAYRYRYPPAVRLVSLGVRVVATLAAPTHAYTTRAR